MSLKILCAGCSSEERAAVEAGVRAGLGDRARRDPWTVSLVKFGTGWSVTLDGPTVKGRRTSFMVPGPAGPQALADAVALRRRPQCAGGRRLLRQRLDRARRPRRAAATSTSAALRRPIPGRLRGGAGRAAGRRARGLSPLLADPQGAGRAVRMLRPRLPGRQDLARQRPVIFSGLTHSSNCSPVTRPSSIAVSRSVRPVLCAVLAIFAALS